MGRTMQISSPVRAVGRKHHVIGTSMSSKKRGPGNRSSALSQEEYSIFSPVLCPAVVSWVKDPDSAGVSVEDIELNQPNTKDVMSYRSLNGETDFHDAETDFRDADAPGMWKEIHTDISTHTPELEQMHPHPLRPRSPSSFLERSKNPSNSITPERMSPNESGHLPERDQSNVSSSNASIRAVMKSPRSKYMIPSTASPDDFYAQERASTSNSPQHPSMWSPHRAPTKSLSTLPALDIPSPRGPKNFGWLTPTRQHNRVPEPRSPDFAKPPQPLRDARMSPSHIPPPARESWSPPETITKSPARPATTMKSKRQAKLQQHQLQQQQQQLTQQQHQLQQLQQQEFHHQQKGNASPRQPALSFTTSKVEKPDKSPGKGWKNLSRSISPMFTGKKTEVGSTLRGIGRDLGASFQGSKRRAPANAGRSDGPVASAPVADWSRCSGDGSMVAPELEKEPSGGDSDRLSSELSQLTRTGSTKSSSIKSGSNSMFSFMSWGRNKNRGSKVNELFPPVEQGTVKLDSNSFKVMDYTIKTLQYKLEQAKKNELTTANEFKALELAMHAAEGKCKELQQRCQELESELIKRKAETRDVELDYETAKHRRDNTATGFKGTRFATLEVTSQLFQKAFDDSKLNIKKLASALCIHIRESGASATQVITSLLEQQKDAGRWVSKMPRNVIILYFESFLNQVLYENFENVSFEPNGTSPIFDPDALKASCCKAYNDLKKQEWAAIEKSLGKPGSTIVNPTFHRFFVIRMELILSQLTKVADKETSLALLASFFNAFKSVWLLHHLAFAHEAQVTIFRVPSATDFDPRFMEQVTTYEEDPSRSKISVMVNPGFIVNRQTIKCQVFCSSKYQ
ncbi:hypothetical protein M758_1G263900 [Ceratodon purpureus]|nr:hypothetical protein M758_1G263900 [Ceratodon purpureus]